VLLHFGFNILYIFLNADIGFFVILTVLHLIVTSIAVLIRNRANKLKIAEKKTWNFENWGILYWSKTKEFLKYLAE